jgi:hypothetical protein
MRLHLKKFTLIMLASLLVPFAASAMLQAATSATAGDARLSLEEPGGK